MRLAMPAQSIGKDLPLVSPKPKAGKEGRFAGSIWV